MIDIRHGDCLALMAAMEPNTIDAVVTDAPYHLTSIVKRFGAENAAPAKHGTDGAFARASRGFMGQTWDGGDIAFRPETWAEVYRVMKPGAHLLAFGGTRTFHRMMVAIEDAGFELRDTMMWLYGVGFPKSHDVSKGIDKHLGAERTVVGVVDPRSVYDGRDRTSAAINTNWRAAEDRKDVRDLSQKVVTEPASSEAAEWVGWGTALKPAYEPIALFRKPLEKGLTVAQNVLKWGTGALNIDGCRVELAGDYKCKANGRPSQTGLGDNYDPATANQPDNVGRWPANLVLDGSDEVEAAFAAYGEKGGGSGAPIKRRSSLNDTAAGWGMRANADAGARHGDSGSAARFFYSAKAGRKDRVSRDVEEVEISWISDCGPSLVKLQVDTEASLQKAIVVSGSADASALSTFLFGRSFTDLCRTALSCTISTGTSSTTESRIWNSLTTSLTSASTAAAKCEMESGGSPAAAVVPGIGRLTITFDETVYLPGAGSVASRTPLEISVSARKTGHPTCKPVSLMQWLVRMVTPPGGVVLDPFAGSGTTGAAAELEGFDAVLCEQSAEYVADIRRRFGQEEVAAEPTLEQILAEFA